MNKTVRMIGDKIVKTSRRQPGDTEKLLTGMLEFFDDLENNDYDMLHATSYEKKCYYRILGLCHYIAEMSPMSLDAPGLDVRDANDRKRYSKFTKLVRNGYLVFFHDMFITKKYFSFTQCLPKR